MATGIRELPGSNPDRGTSWVFQGFASVLVGVCRAGTLKQGPVRDYRVTLNAKRTHLIQRDCETCDTSVRPFILSDELFIVQNAFNDIVTKWYPNISLETENFMSYINDLQGIETVNLCIVQEKLFTKFCI